MAPTQKHAEPAATTATGVDGQKEKRFIIELFHYDDGSIDYFTYDQYGNVTQTKERENAYKFLTLEDAMGTLARLLITNSRKFARYHFHFQNDYPLISEY